ncbi:MULTISPECIES: PcfB family protein [Actinotignum]|nr:PcfB family protein [Actinotignum timonense]MDK8283701.1 PcfB family protein [Actinotignum timonense]
MSIMGGEQIANTVTATLLQAGLKITGYFLTGSLQAVRLTAQGGLKHIAKLKGVAPSQREHGRMTIKTLQRKGGDLHSAEITPENLAALKKYLRRAGVDFALERAGEGYFVHFQGSDVALMQHALARIEADLTPTRQQASQSKPGTEKDTPEKIASKKEGQAPEDGTPEADAPAQTGDVTQPGATTPNADAAALSASESQTPQAPATSETLPTSGAAPGKKPVTKEKLQTRSDVARAIEKKARAKKAALNGRPPVPAQVVSKKMGR